MTYGQHSQGCCDQKMTEHDDPHHHGRKPKRVRGGQDARQEREPNTAVTVWRSVDERAVALWIPGVPLQKWIECHRVHELAVVALVEQHKRLPKPGVL